MNVLENQEGRSETWAAFFDLVTRELPELHSMRVCVVGLGYIGLPTACLLAAHGMEVVGVDTNQAVLSPLRSGTARFREPGLTDLAVSTIRSGKLSLAERPQAAEVFLLAVPTPFKLETGPDLSFLNDAVRSIAEHLAPDNLVILESTGPVGTTEVVAELLSSLRPDLSLSKTNGGSRRLFLAYCPERALPGRVLEEMVSNDRIVGGFDLASTQRAYEFYRAFTKGDVLKTGSRTAEMVKLSENTFRDVNIAFANEIRSICEEKGIDPWEVIELANRHPRVNILHPGPGVGGHCIAVDPWFLIHSAGSSPLLRSARGVNDAQPGVFIGRILAASRRFARPTLALMGLAFKADVEDLRESPALRIAVAVSEAGVGDVLVVEPYLERLPPELRDFQNVRLVSIDSALEIADVVALLVNHRTFGSVAPSRLRGKEVIDARGMWRTDRSGRK